VKNERRIWTSVGTPEGHRPQGAQKVNGKIILNPVFMEEGVRLLIGFKWFSMHFFSRFLLMR
jgi:hypothetical protein